MGRAVCAARAVCEAQRMAPRSSLPWVLLLLLAACPPAVVPPEPAPLPEPDLSGELFVSDRVLEVEIEMAPADWDALRLQTRTIVDIFGGDCLAQPFDDPFDYFPARVTFDGEELGEVGVRKKGFLGSLDSDKPSLKVKLDEFVEGNLFKGLARLTLNNNAQDPAALRQCLGYSLFTAAGLPAPRCNFARVSVNGQELGVFTHLESVDALFLGRHFEDADGDLWEGTLSDFRPGWTGTFEKKTNEDVVDLARIDAVKDAAALPDEELLAALEPLLDLEGFFTLWALESLIGHWDGYAGNTNNFYLYDDPTTQRLHFMPWGIDQTFMNGPEGASPPPVLSTGILARRLLALAEPRARYVARMRELLDTVWDEAALTAEIDRMAALLEPVATPETLTAIEDVRAFVESRRAAVRPALDAGLEPATDPLRDAFCFEDVGDLAGTFATTWGSLGAADVFSVGDGALTGVVWGFPVEPTAHGAAAGADLEHPGRAALQVFALLPDGNVLVVFFDLEEGLVADGSVALDGSSAIGYLVRYLPATDSSELLGVLVSGTLTFDAASRTVGAPVEGSLASDVHWFPF